MTIRVGFLGCGGFARRYHVPTFLAGSNEAVLTAIHDPGKAPELEAIARDAGALRVATIAGLFEPGLCDAVILSTPHMLHAAHARDVVAAGKHLLVDKPFVMASADARELARSAASRGIVAGVAFNRRLDRGCLRARELIRSGAIGRVRYVETVQLGYERGGWFLDPTLGGGGPFTGRATHMADLIPWLLDRHPRELRARIRGGSPTRADDGGFIELRFDEAECHMTCVVEGWHSWDEVRVFGEDGLVELRRPLKYPIGWELRAHTRRYEAMEYLEADPAPGGATRNFLAAIAGRETIACSFADALISVRIIDEAFRSARGDGGWRSLSD